MIKNLLITCSFFNKRVLNFVLLFSLVVMFGCQNDIQEQVISVKDSRLELLEKKFNVKIEKTQNRDLSESEISLIENILMKFRNDQQESNGKEFKLTRISSIVKTKANETVNIKQWLYNASWLNVSVSVFGDSSASVTSWLSGVSVYSYSQQGLWHDFSPGRKQTTVSFSFIAVGTFELLDKIGIRISLSDKFAGYIDLLRGVGTVSLNN